MRHENKTFKKKKIAYHPKENKTKNKMHSLITLLLLSSLWTVATVTAQDNNNNNNNNNGNEEPDFGSCTPTMDFQLGREAFNRDADEGTFFPTDDSLIANSGQADALNPNIITNFICDQLVNVCGANEAAQNQCSEAQALVAGLEDRDESTAEAFNEALGF